MYIPKIRVTVILNLIILTWISLKKKKTLQKLKDFAKN